MNFKDAYKFPLEYCHGMVFTGSGDKAFDFANKWTFKNAVLIDTDSKQGIINIINGDNRKIKNDLKLSLKDGMIYCDVDGIKKEFILIRGWGMLTGIGGLNLDDDIAYKIQNDFADYIIERLTNAYYK